MSGGRIRRRAEAGFVLVNALIVVAALSMVAVQALQGSERGRRAAGDARVATQLDLLGDLGTASAVLRLDQDFRDNRFDHRGEAWALSNHEIETGHGTVRITVVDLESRLNVNLLATDATGGARAALEALLADAGLAADSADALHQRLPEPQPGAEDAAAPSGDGSFRREDVVGWDDLAASLAEETPVPEGLRAVLTALPRDSGVNVNTADPAVLGALLGARGDLLSALLARRASRPFEDAAALRAFAETDGGDGGALPWAALAVQSAWFEVTTEARIGNETRRVRATLARDPDTGRTRIVATAPAGRS